MENKIPATMKPGHSNLGSGNSDGAFGKVRESMGELTPPGWDPYPTGPATVTYAQGATTVVKGSFDTSQVTLTPLK
jgi:hypothetical protein